VQPGERDWSIEERRQRTENAIGRSGFELGLHGNRSSGLESEGLVWAGDAVANCAQRHRANGVQAVSDQLYPTPLPNREHQPTARLSYSDVSHSSRNVFRHLRLHQAAQICLTPLRQRTARLAGAKTKSRAKEG